MATALSATRTSREQVSIAPFWMDFVEVKFLYRKPQVRQKTA